MSYLNCPARLCVKLCQQPDRLVIFAQLALHKSCGPHCHVLWGEGHGDHNDAVDAQLGATCVLRCTHLEALWRIFRELEAVVSLLSRLSCRTTIIAVFTAHGSRRLPSTTSTKLRKKRVELSVVLCL
jgi:hypothetical protein